MTEPKIGWVFTPVANPIVEVATIEHIESVCDEALTKEGYLVTHTSTATGSTMLRAEVNGQAFHLVLTRARR